MRPSYDASVDARAIGGMVRHLLTLATLVVLVTLVIPGLASASVHKLTLTYQGHALQGGYNYVRTPDGRYLLFTANTGILTPAEVYRYDSQTGTTVQVDMSTIPTDHLAWGGINLAISPNGQFAVFASTYGNTDNFASQLWIYNFGAPLPNLPTDVPVLVSVNTAGQRATLEGSEVRGGGFSPAVSDAVSGHLSVVFESSADNLWPGFSGNNDNSSDLYVRDVIAGTTRPVLTTANGGQVPVGLYDGWRGGNPQISADGCRIAFDENNSDASIPWINPYTHTNGNFQDEDNVFVRDRCDKTKALLPPSQWKTIPINIRTAPFYPPPACASLDPGCLTQWSFFANTAPGYWSDLGVGSFALSADGSKVIFSTDADNLNPADFKEFMIGSGKDWLIGKLLKLTGYDSELGLAYWYYQTVQASLSQHPRLYLHDIDRNTTTQFLDPPCRTFTCTIGDISANTDGSWVAWQAMQLGVGANEHIYVMHAGERAVDLTPTIDGGSGAQLVGDDGTVVFGSQATNLTATPSPLLYQAQAGSMTARMVLGPAPVLEVPETIGSTLPVGLLFAGTSVAPPTYTLDQKTAAGWQAVILPHPTAGAVSVSIPLDCSAHTYRAGFSAGGVTLAPLTGPTFRACLHRDTDPAVSYTPGAWTTAKSAAFDGGVAHTSSKHGAKTTLKFTGREVGFVTTTGPGQGVVQIRLDSTLVMTVDLSKPNGAALAATAHRRLAVRFGWPTPGAHTITVTVLSGAVQSDGFVTIG